MSQITEDTGMLEGFPTAESHTVHQRWLLLYVLRPMPRQPPFKLFGVSERENIGDGSLICGCLVSQKMLHCLAVLGIKLEIAL